MKRHIAALESQMSRSHLEIRYTFNEIGVKTYWKYFLENEVCRNPEMLVI
jgi:hypothetical protein